MTQVALHGLFDYITTLNLSDRSLDWLTDKLQSIKKKRNAVETRLIASLRIFRALFFTSHKTPAPPCRYVRRLVYSF